MNVILFGATGMVGQGVLRECLLDPISNKSSQSDAAPPASSTQSSVN